MESLAAAVHLAYGGVLAVLAVFGFHRYVLLELYRRTRHVRPPSRPLGPDRERWPRVLVQLPVYDEPRVVERLVRAAGALDYPRSRLEIQLLDDSDDATPVLAERAVAEVRRRGVAIEHLRRPDRTGFKAGALAHGLERSGAELVAVFDADFVPAPDWLRRTVPYFTADDVGMVQTRWEHLNRDHSWLTRLQAVLLDGHFAIEHGARYRSGRFFNFNGTAGLWRRAAIEDAGGWEHDTVTEDLDLSYRAQLRGWRFVYEPRITVPAELPAEIDGFRSQQARWAMGSAQTARKLLPRILSAPLPWSIRAEAAIHLTGNLSYVAMVALLPLVLASFALRDVLAPSPLLVGAEAVVFALATLPVLLFYGVAQLETSGRTRWPLLPLAMALGAGLSLVCGRAVLRGLRTRGGVFVRTPKLGLGGNPGAGPSGQDPGRGPGAPAGTPAAPRPWPWAELVYTAVAIAAIATAGARGAWAATPVLSLFALGYGSVAASALLAGGRRAPAGEPSLQPLERVLPVVMQPPQ